MTEDERAEKVRQQVERFNLLQPYLEEGVTITHTVCMGTLKEHVLVDFEQLGMGPIGMIWLTGYPTGDTMRIDGAAFTLADDISPMNVTHVNRVPIDLLEAIGKKAETPFQLFDATIVDPTLADIPECACCEKCGQPVLDQEVPF